jgi:biopolymer transport protein ExbB/TolQ
LEGSQTPDAAHDLSFVGLIQHADIVVQAVVAGLFLCSIVSWAVMIEKIVRLRGLRRATGILEYVAHNPGQPLGTDSALPTRIIAAARDEFIDAQAAGEGGLSLRNRLEEAMRVIYIAELRRLETGLSFLATIGSSAPFIGLFGTVWGIMRSFTSIAAAKDTSLAVVAPGIAEALVATAIGLAAAIPAVIAYNQILASLSRAGQRLGAAVAAIAKNSARAGLGAGAPVRAVRS